MSQKSRVWPRWLTAVALLALAVDANAGPTAEQQCQRGRYAAAAKYAQCEPKVAGKIVAGGDPFALQTSFAKCRVKYAAAWPKLQAKASGSGATCDASRFVDNGNGTVTDNLTALQWEKKVNLNFVTNPSDPHDADNKYALSASGTAGDGNAYTTYLPALNGGACFAGHCDWRVPTRSELQTIVADPCTSGPCIDPSFGPTNIPIYWTATTLASLPVSSWIVNFNDFVGWGPKTDGEYVRAVRGGL